MSINFTETLRISQRKSNKLLAIGRHFRKYFLNYVTHFHTDVIFLLYYEGKFYKGPHKEDG